MGDRGVGGARASLLDAGGLSEIAADDDDRDAFNDTEMFRASIGSRFSNGDPSSSSGTESGRRFDGQGDDGGGGHRTKHVDDILGAAGGDLGGLRLPKRRARSERRRREVETTSTPAASVAVATAAPTSMSASALPDRGRQKEPIPAAGQHSRTTPLRRSLLNGNARSGGGGDGGGGGVKAAGSGSSAPSGGVPGRREGDVDAGGEWDVRLDESRGAVSI